MPTEMTIAARVMTKTSRTNVRALRERGPLPAGSVAETCSVRVIKNPTIRELYWINTFRFRAGLVRATLCHLKSSVL